MRRKPFAAKNPRRQTCHFAPRPLLWLNTLKPTLERSRNLPWWNLGEPSTEPFETEPCGNPRWIRSREPETPRNLKNLGGTLVEPWWNLPRNLLAAQENHRESESNSAPKPLLWLKTPKILLLGKNVLETHSCAPTRGHTLMLQFISSLFLGVPHTISCFHVTLIN